MANARQDLVKTVPTTMKAIRRIIGMLDIEFPPGSDDVHQGKACTASLVSAMHVEQIVCKMFALRVMCSDLGWSRAMLSSMKHFAEFARACAMSERLDDDKRNIEDMQMKFKKLTVAHTDSKEESRRKRIEKDADRIEQQPENDEVRKACRQAMFDLVYLKQKTSGQKNLTVGQRTAANTIMIGLMHCNGKPGRCGEWTTILMADAEQRFLSDDIDWIAAEGCKNFRRRGASIKVLAPGTRAGLKVFMDLPGQSECKYLFQAPRSGSGSTFASYIKNFDLAYFGRVCHFGSNLYRKKRANLRKEAEDQGQLSARFIRHLGAWEDGHAMQTEEKNYIAMPQKRKADIARQAMMIEIDPVDWLTEEEMGCMTTVYFAKRRKGDGGISAEAEGELARAEDADIAEDGECALEADGEGRPCEEAAVQDESESDEDDDEESDASGHQGAHPAPSTQAIHVEREGAERAEQVATSSAAALEAPQFKYRACPTCVWIKASQLTSCPTCDAKLDWFTDAQVNDYLDDSPLTAIADLMRTVRGMQTVTQQD